MAYITLESGDIISEPTTLVQFLTNHGIFYEYWDPSVLSDRLQHGLDLSDQEKESVFECFQSDLERLSEQHGYTSHDMIILSATTTPNLEELLTNFQREHHHTEDEVRFIVDGEGVFTLTRNDERFGITVTPGDLISVPYGTRHYFTLTDKRHVKAIRLFQSKEGWTAIYDKDVSAS